MATRMTATMSRRWTSAPDVRITIDPTTHSTRITPANASNMFEHLLSRCGRQTGDNARACAAMVRDDSVIAAPLRGTAVGARGSSGVRCQAFIGLAVSKPKSKRSVSMTAKATLSMLEACGRVPTGPQWPSVDTPGVGTAEHPEPPRLLVAIEPGALRRLVLLILNHGQYDKRSVATTAEAKRAIAEWQPHLVVLDLDLVGEPELLIGSPDEGSIEVPVIGLTRRHDLSTKLAAFERGVDDLLTIPFAPGELVARALALMRRRHGVTVQFRPRMKIGDLEIDLLAGRLVAEGSEIELTPRESALLYVLAANAGTVMSRDQLLEYVLGPAAEAIGSNLIDRHVRELRMKLKDTVDAPRFIESVRGQGYRFLDPDLPHKAA